MRNEKLKKARIREEQGKMIQERRVLNGQFEPIPKEDAKKIIKAMADTFPELDLQIPPDQIDKAPESAMQAKLPNGDPFDNMYRRQHKT